MEKIERGMVGVMIQNIHSELAMALSQSPHNAAVVTQVTPGTPAALSGLQTGDLIHAVNGKPIKSAAMVRNAIGLLRVGSRITLDISRQGKSISIQMKSISPKAMETKLQNEHPFLFGLNLQTFNQDFHFQGPVRGVQIMNIVPNSPAWQAGALPGDVILSANQKPIETIETLKQIAANTKGDYLLLNILRPRGAVFIPIKRYSEEE